jgi:type IV pilus assembly protein PilO
VVLPPAIDSFVHGPRLPKVVVGLFGLVAALGAAWYLALAPQSAELARLEAERADLQVKLTQNRAIVADLARYRRELAELRQRLALLQEKLPTERETPPLYRTVHEAAIQAGLAVSLFQPRDARARDYYSELPIAVTAEGGYHDLGVFLQRVARLPRVVNVGEIRATSLTRARTSMRADLTLATYMYRPAGAAGPTPGAPPPAGATPAPAPPAPAGARP